MKWIKVSERLPEVNDPNVVPVKITRCDGSVYYSIDDDNGIKWLMHPKANGSTVEWLDESVDQIMQGSGEVFSREDMKDFLEQTAINNYQAEYNGMLIGWHTSTSKLFSTEELLDKFLTTRANKQK